MRILILLMALLAPSLAAAQSAVLQGGPWTSGRAPMYSIPGSGQAVVQDSGPAGGGGYGVGLAEFLQVNRGPGVGPYANAGTGPYATNACFYDGPTTGAYHYICLDANAQGSALLAIGYGGGASPQGLTFIVDGVTYTFPFPGTGTVTSVAQTFTGGLISVAGSPITTSGTLALTVAGTSGGIPYFSSTSGWASSSLLVANALMVGGGAGVAPSTVTTGTGVLTALGVNTGSAGAFVVNGGALGTPSSGTLTNASGLPIAGITGLGTNVAGALAIATESTGSFARQNGAITSGNCLKWSVSGIQDNGGACLSAGGPLSGTTLTLTNAATLAAGTTSIAPLKFQSGTNLTTATAGVFEYDGTVFYSSPAASNRGLSPTEYYVALTSTRTFANNTSAQAIFAGGGGPTNGEITLPVGSYFFDMSVGVSGLSSSAHTVSLGFAGTATISSIGYNQAGGNALGNWNVFVSSASATRINGAGSDTGTTWAFIAKGILRVSVTGTVISQLTQGTNSAAAVVAANSYMRIMPIGGASAAYLGNWD